MARKRSETEVENYRHDAAKRLNIPTAENQSLVPDDEKALKVLRYPRNPDLDPQLVWRGKDAEDGAPLEVAAPPIYIQEKIHPQALIEELRRQSARRKNERAEQTDLFHDFNGLPEGWIEDAAASYYHDEGRWQNRMILGDSLLVMGSLAEREALRGKVQCIYFDPPYGIKFNSNWQPSVKSPDVKDGKEDSVSREPEVVRAFRDTWKDGVHSYLSYLRDRLTIARDLLSDTGSVFVQIGDENVHRVRAIMDEVYGEKNFISAINYVTTSGRQDAFIDNISNHIVWFARNKAAAIYRQLFLNKNEKENLFIADQFQSDGFRKDGDFPIDCEGRTFRPKLGNHWKVKPEGAIRVGKAGRPLPQKEMVRYKRYASDFLVRALPSVWTDTSGGAGRDKLYVVQSNSRLAERCILMTTDPGDLVLDPTCGSGTTAYVAEQWGRRWITVDTSRVALTLDGRASWARNMTTINWRIPRPVQRRRSS